MVEAKPAEAIVSGESVAAVSEQPEQPAIVSTTGLAEPTSDKGRCEENTEDLHGFGIFSYKQEENRTHYDSYAAKYDGMQDMSGFNDPYELAKTAVEKLG